MPGKASGVKGDAFERSIAKFFNQLFGVAQFGKSPSSGARMGKSNFAKNNGLAESAIHTMICDIITPDSFPFVIECKSYADAPQYHTLIKDSERNIDNWLKEVEFDANNVGKIPMLAFKTNNKGTHFVIPFDFLSDTTSIPYYAKYRNYIIIGSEHMSLIKDQLWSGE